MQTKVLSFCLEDDLGHPLTPEQVGKKIAELCKKANQEDDIGRQVGWTLSAQHEGMYIPFDSARTTLKGIYLTFTSNA